MYTLFAQIFDSVYGSEPIKKLRSSDDSMSLQWDIDDFTDEAESNGDDIDYIDVNNIGRVTVIKKWLSTTHYISTYYVILSSDTKVTTNNL